MPILALALLAQLPAADPTEVSYVARVAAPMNAGSNWLSLDVGDDCNRTVNLDGDAPTEVVWFRDRTVKLGREELRVGTQVRACGVSEWQISRIEIVTLGPLALDFAVEEWAASLPDAKPGDALTRSELATIEAWGSESWLVRDSVSKALRERGSRALRLLVHAKKSPDAEVRARAKSLLVLLGWTE